MFEKHWGGALNVARVADGLPREDVLTKLNTLTGRDISLALFEAMEEGTELVDPALFELWCSLFSWGKIKTLKCAQLLEENAGRPVAEILREIMEEARYQIWKGQQQTVAEHSLSGDTHMSFPVRFNWVLQIEPPDQLRVGESYTFSKPENRIFPVGAPIDLIDMHRQAIAKVKVTTFTQNGTYTIGSFTVIKLYEGAEKEVLTNYWKENV